MSRPWDWSPLTFTDPVPGDPAQVAASARHYHDTAKAIQHAAANLKKICDRTADARGKYIEAFREKANGLAGKIDQAYDRYNKTADALQAYAPALERAQQTADDARIKARAAHEEAERWEAAKPSWSGPEPGSLGDVFMDVDEKKWHDYKSELDRCQARVDDAQAEIEKQRKRMWQAVADRNAAAKKAREAIDEVSQHDGLKDSWWDNFKQALAAIASVASLVATVCGVLSLVVGWIPVIGQALAAVLGTIALVAGIISLACTIVLACAGDASWGDVAIGAIGVLSFGVGRAAGATLRLGSRLGRLGAVGSRVGLRAGMRGVGAGLRSGRLAGNARLASAGRWLTARGAPLPSGTLSGAWRETAAAGRTFAHDGFATAFRGPHAFGSDVDKVWQGLRTPRRLVQLEDGDAARRLVSGQAGQAVVDTYFGANYRGAAYSGGALTLAGTNFVANNTYMLFHDVPGALSSSDGPIP